MKYSRCWMEIDYKNFAKCKSSCGCKPDNNLKARLLERCKTAIFLELFFFITSRPEAMAFELSTDDTHITQPSKQEDGKAHLSQICYLSSRRKDYCTRTLSQCTFFSLIKFDLSTSNQHDARYKFRYSCSSTSPLMLLTL